MYGIFLLEMVALLFFVQSWFFSSKSSYALAITALTDTTYAKPGSATEQFIDDLENAGFKPIINQNIKRIPFSVKGALISLNGDNLEVFEYPDHNTALNYGTMFVQKYKRGITLNRWKNIIHLYIRDKIIIFYMGTEKNVLTALDKNQEFSLIDPSLAGPKVSD
jgi:hypothetical protein